MEYLSYVFLLLFWQEFSQSCYCHEFGIVDVFYLVEEGEDVLLSYSAVELTMALYVEVDFLLYAHVFAKLMEVLLESWIYDLSRTSLQQIDQLNRCKSAYIFPHILFYYIFQLCDIACVEYQFFIKRIDVFLNCLDDALLQIFNIHCFIDHFDHFLRHLGELLLDFHLLELFLQLLLSFLCFCLLFLWLLLNYFLHLVVRIEQQFSGIGFLVLVLYFAMQTFISHFDQMVQVAKCRQGVSWTMKHYFQPSRKNRKCDERLFHAENSQLQHSRQFHYCVLLFHQSRLPCCFGQLLQQLVNCQFRKAKNFKTVQTSWQKLGFHVSPEEQLCLLVQSTIDGDISIILDALFFEHFHQYIYLSMWDLVEHITQIIHDLFDEDMIFLDLQILRREGEILMCHGDAVEHPDIFPGLQLFILSQHFSSDSQRLSFGLHTEEEQWPFDQFLQCKQHSYLSV